MKNLIIGLTGTFGAGKGEVARYLKGKGFAYHSCSDILRIELKLRGVEENIENLSELGNRIRMTHGDGELARRLLQLIRSRDEKNSVVDSLRTLGEIEELRKAGNFHLLALDALPEIRYARIKLRNRPGDNVSYEKFLEQERSQLGGGLGRQNLQLAMGQADFAIINEGTIEELRKKVDDFLKHIE